MNYTLGDEVMKLVLFDLGQTLEDHDVLLPGALQALEDISALRDGDGEPVLLGARVGLRRARPTSTTTSSKT